MNWRISFLLVGLFVGTAAAEEPVKLDSLKVGARTYRSLTVLGSSETDLYFKHSRGIANVKLKYLETEMQKLFNYDPKAAAAAELRQAREDAAFHETVALELTTRAQRAMKAARDASTSTAESLADPVSVVSLLGQAAPKLTVEKWLGETPDLKDKAVLIFFWTTWSIPCRKMIPEMDGYQKKFSDKLVVIGLSSQPLNELTEFNDSKIEFALAMDTKTRLGNAAGVTSVPFVLLVDAKGIVRYQGHPGALDTAKLRKLLNPEPKE